VVGPHPLVQHRTCVSGQECFMDGIIGNHVTSLDAWIVLQTCGEVTVIDRLTNGGSVVDVAPLGASLYFGTTVLSLGGGEYRLCWCATMAGCTTASHFRVDVGELSVIGPNGQSGASDWTRGLCGPSSVFMTAVTSQALAQCRSACERNPPCAAIQYEDRVYERLMRAVRDLLRRSRRKQFGSGTFHGFADGPLQSGSDLREWVIVHIQRASRTGSHGRGRIHGPGYMCHANIGPTFA
jgi:hypothetical protein